MNQQERVIRYVLDNGPCSDEAVYLNAGKRSVTQQRRYLRGGAPAGTVAYERKRGGDYTFVIAKSPPEGFYPIRLKGEQEGAQ